LWYWPAMDFTFSSKVALYGSWLVIQRQSLAQLSGLLKIS
jgi:hypothetical protein